MPYRHPAARIHEIVKAPQALVAGQGVSPRKRGSHGLGFKAFVKRVGGLFLDKRHESAPIFCSLTCRPENFRVHLSKLHMIQADVNP